MSQTYISGAKGKGGGKSRAPVEAPDTLHSKQYAKVLDLIGEGEIEGLVAGLESVYLDNTPIQNSDGSFNFSNVTMDFRNGTQDQDHIEGFQGTEVEKSVGLEIKSELPIIQTVADPDIDLLRLTLGVPRLSIQDLKSGDTNGSRIDFKVEVQSNGGGYKDALLTLALVTGGISSSGSPLTVDASSINIVVTDGVGFLGSLTWHRPIVSTNTVTSYVKSSDNPFGFSINKRVETVVNVYGGTPPKVKIEYRNLTTGGGWLEISQNTFKLPDNTSVSGSKVKLDFNDLWPANYEFRCTKLSGTGEITLQGVETSEEVVVETSTALTNSKTGKTPNSSPWTPTTTSISTVYTDPGPLRYSRKGTGSIVGKTINKYQKNLTLLLTGDAPWDIRITKITEDSEISNHINNLYWDSYTAIISEKLTYPNSSYSYLKIDSEQFSRIPTRGFHVRLLRVKVPSNYDPNTRIYSGFWDGTFKVAWTNNPAWCFYDLVINTRYGLGEFIPASQIDKWDLYDIGKYCDEIVPDGLGGNEPRFTCNIYLQTREEAYNILQSMSSIFRGMSYWTGGYLSTVQDAPSVPVAIFSKANVVDGIFSYSGTSLKARHSTALVTWNDPKNFYKQKIEYVEDSDSVARYGIRETEVVAVGCTSRGQANRVGKWLLFSEKEETETVVFASGLDGVAIRPGEIVQVSDDSRAGVRFSGRLATGSSDSTIKLDASVPLATGVSYSLSVVMPYPAPRTLPTGDVVDSNIAAIEIGSFTVLTDNDYTEVTLDSALSMHPKPGSMWLISEVNLQPQLFRVLEIVENDSNTYQITAVEHNESKFAAIDKDEPLQSSSVSFLNNTPDSPTGIGAEEALYISETGSVKSRIQIYWDFESSAMSYVVEFRFKDSNWQILGTGTKASEAVIDDVSVGTYDIRVFSLDSLGRRSGSSADIEGFITLGKTAPPANVTGFTASVVSTGVKLVWDAVADLDLKGYTIKYGASWDSAELLAEAITGTLFEHNKATDGENFYLIKAEDTSGNVSNLITSTVLTLVAPSSVRRFIATQTVNNIQLDWAPLDEAALYEVREGSAWNTSTFVTRTNTTYFNLAAGYSAGDRTFLIKGISSNNLYSFLASATTTAVAEIPYRNIVLTVDKELDSYVGRYINTVNVTDTIQLTDASNPGEFIFDIDVGYFTEAQSTSFYTSSVAEIDTVDWTSPDADFSWESNTGYTRSWLPLQDVDISTVSVDLEISTDPGSLSAKYVDAISLDGTSDTYLGTSLAESVNATTFITSGRTGDGLNRLPNTVASWGVSIPSEFSILIWINPEEAFTDGFEYYLVTLYNTVTSAYLKVTYQNGDLLLTDEIGNTQAVGYALSEDNLFALVLSQSSTERKLMVSNIYDSDAASIDTLSISPSGTFNSLRLY